MTPLVRLMRRSILGGGLFRIPSCPVTMTTIRQILVEALSSAQSLVECVLDYCAKTAEDEEITLTDIGRITECSSNNTRATHQPIRCLATSGLLPKATGLAIVTDNSSRESSGNLNWLKNLKAKPTLCLFLDLEIDRGIQELALNDWVNELSSLPLSRFL